MGLNKKEKKVITSFVEEIRTKLRNEILSIKLFGSKARGDFTKESDVDIFILVKKRRGMRDKINDIASDYFLNTNIPLSPMVCSLYEYKKNRKLGSFFFENIDKEGIIL